MLYDKTLKPKFFSKSSVKIFMQLHLVVIIYLDLTVHGAGEQQMAGVRKQSDCTDTLENK